MYIRLVDLLVLQVIDLVEDEHFFGNHVYENYPKEYIDLAFGASH
jgi:hypothetical protein